MSGQRFRDFIMEEGDLLDAVKVGLQAGVKAFQKKREQQTKTQEKKQLELKLLNAEGKELADLVKQMVEKGYTIQNGKVQQPAVRTLATNWLYEAGRPRPEPV